jgi:hypothetical protein
MPPRTVAAPAPNLRLPTAVALAVAVMALALWLWAAVCAFPSIVWNDLRLAPALALTQGHPIFPTATAGTVNTWTYGPLPPLFYAPAALASTAAGALLVGGVLNLLLTLVPLALVCAFWPAGHRDADTRGARALAFLLCVALWAPRHYAVIFADNLALACALVGQLLLLRAASPRALWLAALCAAAAVACKQTTLGFAVVQVLWLAWDRGWPAALRHLGRGLVVGAIVGAVVVAAFGYDGLRYVLLDLPSTFPWGINTSRFAPMLPELAWQLLVPLAVMLVFRRAFTRTPALRLAALSWLGVLPLGLAALCKTGGWLNSLHALPLWLPGVLVVAATSPVAPAIRRWLALAAAAGAAATVCVRIATAPSLQLRPAVAAYAEADALSAQFRGRLWLPFHPTVALQNERRYDHDEDGLFVRRVCGQPVGGAQLAAHLPPAFQVMALHDRWSDWGMARALMPAGTRTTQVGHWTLFFPGETAARAK